MSIEEVRTAIYKRRDSWWTVYLVDPYASRLVRLVSGWRWVTPNRLTLTAAALGLSAAACFATADRWWLLAGALLFHLSFVFDCMDGKLARLQGSGSIFGGWLDYIFDRLKVLACGVGLMGGMYLETDRPVYLALAFVVVVLDMFHYLDLLEMAKVKDQIRRGLMEARQAHRAPDEPEITTDSVVYEQSEEFKAHFNRWVRIRGFLLNNRIRPRVVSGIEFQMAVFIVAPLIGPAAIIPVTLVMAALLLIFEAALVYKLWLAAMSYNRETATLAQPAAADSVPGSLESGTSDSGAAGPKTLDSATLR